MPVTQKKFTELTEDTAPTGDDLIATAHDPAGTPASRKVKILNLLKRIFLADDTQLTWGAVVDGEFLKRDGTTIVSDTVASGPATQIEESGGPTTLDIGAIVDGEFLKRVGTEIVSATPSGGIGGATGSTDNAVLRADGTGGATAQSSAVSIDDNGAITVPEIAAPSTPAAGKVVIYAKSDNKVYRKGEDGVEAELGGGGGSIAPLVVEDANTVAQRNGSNNQTSHIYETFTDASNYSRLKKSYDPSAGSFTLQTQAAGTGGLRNLKVIIGGTLTNGFVFQNSNFSPLTADAYDLGQGGVRWNAAYSNHFNLSAGGDVIFAGRAAITTPTTNVVRLSDSGLGDTAGMALSFGGTASNTPMLKRSSANLEMRVADDSGYSGFAALRYGYSGMSVMDLAGSGSPEGVITANVGSTYRRTDGGAGTSFYVKESGAGNTGWVAK